ncbi:carbon-nitrogen hydrolase family protein [Saccharophagus sp. K07]|uniref:carbon-nitrogen hydrolase family protein n=1 Tax=Saccharophagus sp. K07 TaxID=2283636 RepID=UPI00351C595D
MSLKVRAAVAQMCSGPDVDANLAQADRLIAQAHNEGTQLLVLPENFAVFGRKDLPSIAEPADHSGPIGHFLADAAKKYGLWIIAGTIPYAASRTGVAAPQGKVFPGCSVWSDSGDCVARYDKCHLFDVDVADGVGRYRESDNFAPGDAPVVVPTPWGQLGMSICYDLRFPEYFRQLVNAGATMLVVPAAFTYRTGEAHWEVLLRARAIENQCFVLASGQGGQHDAVRRTWGHSCIIDPWGSVLASCAEESPSLVVADLDFAALADVRRQMPVLQHRRF